MATGIQLDEQLGPFRRRFHQQDLDRASARCLCVFLELQSNGYENATARLCCVQMWLKRTLLLCCLTIYLCCHIVHVMYDAIQLCCCNQLAASSRASREQCRPGRLNASLGQAPDCAFSPFAQDRRWGRKQINLCSTLVACNATATDMRTDRDTWVRILVRMG